MQLEIGNRLRTLRKQKGLSILQLSKLSEVSTGMISQIERDLVVPTVVSIWRIAKALDTNINYFFDGNEAEEEFIIRRGEHREILTNRGNSSYKVLTPSRNEGMLEVILITLKGGQEYDQQCVHHDGEECGYVLSGVLTVQLNGAQWELYPGDSIYFKSSLPHRYMNFGEEDCVSIWSMTPRFL